MIEIKYINGTHFSYSSDERIKEIEERLDDYKYKMTKFEELQVNIKY